MPDEQPAEAVEGGPGKPFNTYLEMDALLDKLKVVGYDDFITSSPAYKSLSRHYFSVGGKSGEQFYMFVSIAAFLIRQAGINFEQPQEHDDPNAVISGILDEMRKNVMFI